MSRVTELRLMSTVKNTSPPWESFFRGKTDAEGVGRVEHVGGGGYDVSVKRLGYAIE